MKKNFKRFFVLWIFSVFLLSSLFVVHDAFSQQKPVPQGATAPSEQEMIRLREKMEKIRTQRKGDAQLDEDLKTAGEFPQETLDKKFLIKKIIIKGRTVKSLKKRFKYFAKKYVNREVTFKEMVELTDRLTAEYKKKGYITSQVYVPPQKIENDTIKLEAFEGVLGRIMVEGNTRTRTNFINKSFIRKLNKPLNSKDIYRALVKLNQNKDRTVKAVLVPGETPKTSDLKLDVKDDRSMHVGVEWNNLGTRYSGAERLVYTIRDSNLTGYDYAFVM